MHSQLSCFLVDWLLSFIHCLTLDLSIYAFFQSFSHSLFLVDPVVPGGADHLHSWWVVRYIQLRWTHLEHREFFGHRSCTGNRTVYRPIIVTRSSLHIVLFIGLHCSGSWMINVNVIQFSIRAYKGQSWSISLHIVSLEILGDRCTNLD